jgi:hypothetical protein
VADLEEAADDEPANYALPVKKRGLLEVSPSFLTTIWFSMYVQHGACMNDGVGSAGAAHFFMYSLKCQKCSYIMARRK